MDDVTARALTHNETVVRKINEAIERGAWPGEERSIERFRCECAFDDCATMIELSHESYEQVRRSPRHFIVTPGHVMPAVDAIVDRRDGYVVVEKRREAGVAAESSDSRSS